MKRPRRDSTGPRRIERLWVLPLLTAVGFAVFAPADVQWALVTLAIALGWIIGYPVARGRMTRR